MAAGACSPNFNNPVNRGAKDSATSTSGTARVYSDVVNRDAVAGGGIVSASTSFRVSGATLGPLGRTTQTATGFRVRSGIIGQAGAP